jgi:hypothetical protein
VGVARGVEIVGGVVVGGVVAVTVSVFVDTCCVVVGGGAVVLLSDAEDFSSAGMKRKPRSTASARTKTPATTAPMTRGEAHGDLGGGVG